MVLSSVSFLFYMCGVCILALVHLTYNIIYVILNHIFSVSRYLKTLYERTLISELPSHSFLRNELKLCPKIPKHFAVIIEEDISYHDCVKLILWCIISEIPYISFYSSNIVFNPTSLYDVLCTRSKSSLHNIQWGKTFHNNVKEKAKKDINGYKWTPVIEVNMFSSKGVSDTIENVMLSFCHHIHDPNKISIKSVDAKFREEIPLPDPDLGLVCGQIFSLYGFMPWQIRVTEFKHIQTHHNLQIEDFIDTLKSFAYCHQRFGK